MKPIKFKDIEIRQPRWDPNPEKSKTDNSNWRQGIFIIFEDYKGNQYDYMPKWVEVEKIIEMREKVEHINSEKAKEEWRKNHSHTG